MDGVQVQVVAKTLDIHPFMLSRWRKEYRQGKIVPDKRKKVVSLKQEKVEMDKIKRLDNENVRLRQENDRLKKGQRFLAEEQQRDSDASTDMEKNQTSNICVTGYKCPAVAIMPGEIGPYHLAQKKTLCCEAGYVTFIRKTGVSMVAQESTKH